MSHVSTPSGQMLLGLDCYVGSNLEAEGRRMLKGYIAAIETEAHEQERARLRPSLIEFVAIAIAALKDGGGVTYSEATAIGEKVARLVLEPKT